MQLSFHADRTAKPWVPPTLSDRLNETWVCHQDCNAFTGSGATNLEGSFAAEWDAVANSRAPMTLIQAKVACDADPECEGFTWDPNKRIFWKVKDIEPEAFKRGGRRRFDVYIKADVAKAYAEDRSKSQAAQAAFREGRAKTPAAKAAEDNASALFQRGIGGVHSSKALEHIRAILEEDNAASATQPAAPAAKAPEEAALLQRAAQFSKPPQEDLAAALFGTQRASPAASPQEDLAAVLFGNQRGAHAAKAQEAECAKAPEDQAAALFPRLAARANEGARAKAQEDNSAALKDTQAVKSQATSSTPATTDSDKGSGQAGNATEPKVPDPVEAFELAESKKTRAYEAPATLDRGKTSMFKKEKAREAAAAKNAPKNKAPGMASIFGFDSAEDDLKKQWAKSPGVGSSKVRKPPKKDSSSGSSSSSSGKKKRKLVAGQSQGQEDNAAALFKR